VNDPASESVAPGRVQTHVPAGAAGNGATAPKHYFHGTHRTCAPADTLARMRPLLAQMGITRIANVTGLDRTGIPVVMVCRPNSRSVAVAQGKGLTLDAAKASGVMEALEVWHAERIMRPLKLASFEEMRREHRLADVSRLPRAAASRFTPHLPLLWIEGEDLLGGDRAWVPFELVSANYTLPLPPGSGCFQANTNGLASGNHRLEAVSHALCEAVERDATTLWKLRSARANERCALDLASIDDAACRRVLEQFGAARLVARVWDTTTDVGIASFVCLLMDASGEDTDAEFGAGCHPSREVALLRALTEAAQARNTTIAGARDDYAPDAYSAAGRRHRRLWCERLMGQGAPRRAFEQAPSFESVSLEADLRAILARLRGAGIEQAIEVDLTRESVGVPVVRVVVPGLEGLMDDDDYAPGARARSQRSAL
jgi:ribosomal protein S12 methylthiotransferase accessory factor